MIGQRDERQKALQWRVVLSIITVFGWLVFLVLWLFFLVSSFSIAQNIAIFVLSLLVLAAILSVTWVTWGLRYPSAYVPPPGYGQYYPRSRWRSVLGGVAVIIWLSFLVIWLFFYASQFNIYQNLGAILASLLVVGGVAWALDELGRG